MVAAAWSHLTLTLLNVFHLQREFKHYALAERGLKPRTMQDILNVLRRLTAFSGSEHLPDLTTAAIRAFLCHGKLELGWSARTFRLYRQYLKTFFEWCVRAGYLTANPVEPIEKPRLPQRLPRCLSQDEAKRILYAASHVAWGTELPSILGATRFSSLL